LTSPPADKLKKQKPVKESSPLPYKIIIRLHKIQFLITAVCCLASIWNTSFKPQCQLKLLLCYI
jgi:hypothetical protein